MMDSNKQYALIKTKRIEHEKITWNSLFPGMKTPETRTRKTPKQRKIQEKMMARLVSEYAVECTDTSKLLVRWSSDFSCPRSLVYDKLACFSFNGIIAARNAVKPKPEFIKLARENFERHDSEVRAEHHVDFDIPIVEMEGSNVEYYGGTPTDPAVLQSALEYYAFIEFVLRYITVSRVSRALCDSERKERRIVLPWVNVMKPDAGPKLDTINRLFDVDYDKIFWNYKYFARGEDFYIGKNN